MGSLYASYTGNRPPVPDIGTDPDDTQHAGRCRVFLDHVFVYTTSKRLELERGWNRARLFDKPIQWLMPARGSSSSSWFTWEPQRVQRGRPVVPRPIRNIFSPAIQVEVSRLVGVGSKPYVRVDDPDATDAADLSKNVLLDRNERTGWDLDNRLGAYHAAMFGQWIQTIRRELSFIDTKAHPVTGSVACEACGYRLADERIPEEQLRNAGSRFPQAIGRRRIPGKELEFESFAQACPGCGHEKFGPSAVPRPPSGNYQDAGNDQIGRPLFQDLPKGEEKTEPTSPYCFFPANQGIGYQKDDDMREFGIRTPRDLDYLAEHYERGDEITAESDVDLYQHHPVVMGHWGLSYRPEGVWRNHALEDVYVQKPTRKFPRGRVIIMAGRRLLQDSELFIEGTDIPWIDTRVAQWELIENEIWGKSLASDLFSVQVNINSAISQRMDIRQKWTSPKLILHQGQDIQFTGGSDGLWASDVWRVDSRGLPPEVQARYPIPFGHQGADTSITAEIQSELEFVPQISGAFDPETGNVSGAELNYSALLFAATKSAERRKPRIDGFRLLKRRIWTLRLRHVAAFQTDPELIHLRDDHDEMTVRQFRGQALRNQTDVALEDEPLVDSSVALRAGIEQALGWGTLKTSANGGTPATDRLINRALNLPEDLSKDTVVQEKLARREWLTWVEKGVEPGIDEAADHHGIHWITHAGDLLNSRQARILMQVLLVQHQTPWSKVLIAVTRWRQLLAELSAAADLIEQAPALLEQSNELIRQMTAGAEADAQIEGEDPIQADIAARPIVDAKNQQASLMREVQKAQAKLGGAFPDALELRIQVVWQRLLIANGVGVVKGVGTDGATPMAVLVPPLITLVRAWAHALAAYLLWKGMGTAQVAPGGPGAAPGAPAPVEPAAAPEEVAAA